MPSNFRFTRWRSETQKRSGAEQTRDMSRANACPGRRVELPINLTAIPDAVRWAE